jgi:NAD(P)-dependent dehydrogenase (short-subunit alcohol dehydrogenase family)
MSLSKVAVVVGVGPGLGAAAAQRFAKGGYHVALLARNLDKLQPIEQQIKSDGGQATSLACDTGKPAEVASVFGEIKQKLGAPEVLIYNSGPSGMSWPPPSAMDLTPEQFSAAFDSGVVGALACAQQVLPAMIEAGKGTIILTGATAALRGSAKFASLACPKFALRALSQCLAREFQPKRIHVAHVIVDGQIDSPRIRSMMPDREIDTFLNPASIADAYWCLHQQDHTCFTQEMDLRPASEKF